MLRRSRIAEAAAPNRDPTLSRRPFDQLVVDDAGAATEIEGDRAAARGEIAWTVDDRAIAERLDPVQQRRGAALDVRADPLDADAGEPSQAIAHRGHRQEARRAVLEGRRSGV